MRMSGFKCLKRRREKSFDEKKSLLKFGEKKVFGKKVFFSLLCLENPIYKRCEIEAKKDKYRKVLYW